MGADKINSAGSQKNVDNIKNENRLSEEEKAKNEKKSTSEKIQEYYKKHDEHQETIDMMKLDDEQKRLAKKAQDIQKHYSAEQAKGHDFSDLMKTFEAKALEDIKQLEAELDVKRQQMAPDLEERNKNQQTGPKSPSVEDIFEWQMEQLSKQEDEMMKQAVKNTGNQEQSSEKIEKERLDVLEKKLEAKKANIEQSKKINREITELKSKLEQAGRQGDMSAAAIDEQQREIKKAELEALDEIENINNQQKAEDTEKPEQQKTVGLAKKDTTDKELMINMDTQLKNINPAVLKLKNDISSLQLELYKVRVSGNTEEIAKKEIELEQAKSQLDTLKAMQQRLEAEKEQQEIEDIFNLNGFE